MMPSRFMALTSAALNRDGIIYAILLAATIKMCIRDSIDLAIAGFPRPLPGVVLEDYYLEHIVLCLSDGLLAQCGIDLDTHRNIVSFPESKWEFCRG